MTDLDALLAEFAAATKIVTLADLTPAQREAAERIIAKTAGNRKEIKTLKISRYNGNSYVTLYVEAGLPNDEKTLASIFCRDTAHVQVGPRGGVTNIGR
jgi:hypothetical protein